MCDTGYKVIFTKEGAKVIECGITISGALGIQGQRDKVTGLWTIPLNNTRISIMTQEYRKQKEEMSNNVYKLSKVHDATQYLHAAAFSPVKSTLIKAIEAGNFTTWPNLTAHHVKQYLEKSEETIKVHMDQQRKNVRIMKPKENTTSKKGDNTEEPEVEPHITEWTNLTYAAIHDIEGHTYTDLTDRFPSVSSRGYKYIVVLYNFDTNNILAKPMKSRSDAEAIYTQWYTMNLPPKASNHCSK
jgi:hypothetical protein